MVHLRRAVMLGLLLVSGWYACGCAHDWVQQGVSNTPRQRTFRPTAAPPTFADWQYISAGYGGEVLPGECPNLIEWEWGPGEETSYTQVPQPPPEVDTVLCPRYFVNGHVFASRFPRVITVRFILTDPPKGCPAALDNSGRCVMAEQEIRWPRVR